ncbi:hypothetical protein INT43_000147 [Umbelopsis isabellina]|uniref:Uncharacterized protein n=1 Tax=Mortierella isabellina TaxID=91625 RepID=A0A8H7PF82_MORIS|nr:hypothetical protein INT43_000147 [Umbelopsis isabellina]
MFGTCQYWDFPEPIAQVSTCNDKAFPDIAFVLTEDGTLWKIDGLTDVETLNSERPPKRIKRSPSSGMLDGEIRRVNTEQIISRKRTSTAWIQAYVLDGTVGCLIYNIDGSLCFCSVDGSERNITQKQSVDSNFIAVDDVVVQTYLPGGSLSGSLHLQGKRIDAVLFGTKKGKIYYKAIDETSEVCILDHPEPMQNLHLCPNIQAQKSSNHSGNELVETITAIAINILYALSAENAIHRIDLDCVSAHMSLNESLACDVNYEMPLVGIALTQPRSSGDKDEQRLIGILEDQTITEIQLMDGVTELTDSNVLQARIQETLQEIEKCQQDEASLDNLNVLYNTKLTEYNSTIYKLQRMLKVATDSNEAQPSTFHCDIFPKIRDDSLCSLITTETLVHIQLRTDMSLKWKHWRVNVDIDPSETAVGGERLQGTILGEHFSCSLEKLEIASQWEQDLSIHINELGLPVYVNVNLAYAPFSDSLTEFQHTTPGTFSDRCSLSLYTKYKSFQLNIEIPAIFYCKQVLFDVIHYALPCEPIMRAKYETRGLKEITGDVRFNSWHNGSSTYDVCLKKNIRARVPKSFKLHAKTNISLATKIDHNLILKNLLMEGLDSALLNEICIKPNKAMFTIPIHRATPVLITVDEGELYVDRIMGSSFAILVECHQPFVLLKALQALYMRLTFMTDNKGIFIRFTTKLHCALYLQKLADRIFLEVSNDKHDNTHNELLRLENMFREDIDRSDEISKTFDQLSDVLDSLIIDLVV